MGSPYLICMAILLVPVFGCGDNCETSSFLQKNPETREIGLSQTMSFNSPEFQKLLPKVDEKMRPIKTAKVHGKMCLRMVQALAKPHTTMKRPGLVHTGVIIPEEADSIPGWIDAGRKLRLLPMSFLASQDLQNTKLYFWANVEETHPLIQEIFRPLMGQYGKYIEIKKFDAAAELKKVCSNFESGSTGNLSAELMNIYESQEFVTSKSDLMRSMLLYNYGGAWMDSDVLLVQNLAPILEEDWVALMYKDFVNQATLSVSRPGSPFITAWMGQILKAGVKVGWSAYGPAMLKRMIKEAEDSARDLNFHVLPPCFFEGALSRHSVVPGQKTGNWSDFFALESDPDVEEKLNYIDPHATELSTFGFHWHNRWEIPIAKGSVADSAEKLYCEQLNITIPGISH